ncbi:MAG: hypothetical protein AAF541_22445 [Pseudomonadota bacterium]
MTKSQIQLIVIMSVSLVSLGGSYLLYYLAQDGDGWGTTNHGEFVRPNLNVNDIGWRVAVPDDTQQARWWLWVVAKSCNRECEQKMKDIRAAHILLNKEASRVRRGYTDLGGSIGQEDLAEPDSLAGLVVSVTVENTQRLKEGVYIVDPIGNLVFHYTMDHSPKEILTDLKKLLKVSQIG